MSLIVSSHVTGNSPEDQLCARGSAFSSKVSPDRLGFSESCLLSTHEQGCAAMVLVKHAVRKPSAFYVPQVVDLT